MTAPVVTIPDTPEGLQDVLSDPAKLNAINADGKLGDFIQAYAKASVKRDPEIQAQIDEGVQKGLVNLFRDNQIDAKPPVNLTPGNAAGNHALAKSWATVQNNGQSLRVPRPFRSDALGASADALFKNRAEYWQTINEGPSNRSLKNRDELASKREQLQVIQNSFGSVVPADGGFLIPEVMRDELLMLALEQAVVRPRATVIPMSSLRVPIPAVDETTHVGSIRGGITAYWTEEAATLTESQAAFSRIVLEAKKLTAYAGIPNELLADAPAFEGFMDQAFPEALVWFEDIGFFSGTGAGEPLGWLNATAAVQVDPAVTSQVAYADVVNMYSRMLPGSLNRAVWICGPDTWPQLAQMTFGTNGYPVVFAIGGGTSTPFMSLFGRPIIISEKNPALGTNGSLSFVDLSYYLIGDRQVMQADTSEHYLFGNDKTAYRIIERVDGRPWIQSAITPENGSTNTLSPFVQLSGTHT